MASATLIATLTPVKLEPYIDPEGARTLALQFAPTQTLARGTVISQRTSDGKAVAYDDALTNGAEACKGFLVYDIVVDSVGRITYGPSGSAFDLTRGYDITSPIYWKGTFLQSDLTGLDATAITEFGGRVQGVGATKTITIG